MKVHICTGFVMQIADLVMDKASQVIPLTTTKTTTTPNVSVEWLTLLIHNLNVSGLTLGSKVGYSDVIRRLPQYLK
jgi:hypothetical protein